ncbi:sulfatase [Luteibaculum oceani]|nr:sulfatase [Luteibaculum oceani]
MHLPATLFLSLILFSCQNIEVKETQKPNIIFISVDDLRPDLGAYGNPHIKTPNIDAFAEEALLLENAYCQAAVCAPSRASLMQGIRPDSTKVWHLGDEFRKINPNAVTMPQYFHNYGYYTVNIGKIFHNYMPDSVSWDEPDLKPAPFNGPDSHLRDAETYYHTEDAQKIQLERRKEILARWPEGRKVYADGWYSGPAYEVVDLPDSMLYDGLQTKLALQTLKRLKEKEQPIFLGLGYFRPHLPFVAPKKYWDMYPAGSLPPAVNPFLPKNAPPMAANASYELRNYAGFRNLPRPEGAPLAADSADILKRGYYACVSYVDACIGELVAGLKELGIYDNSIIVIWGDHGWKLGEHNGWGKQTNFNIDTKVPLLIKYPGQKQGLKSPALVELVDMFPTLCDLADVPKAGYFQGISMQPLFENPNREWKSAVFSQFRRRPRISYDGKEYMGYAMQTERYRYIEWYTWDNENKIRGELKARELYDHFQDPDENINRAEEDENKALVESLSKKLAQGWRAAVPTP